MENVMMINNIAYKLVEINKPQFALKTEMTEAIEMKNRPVATASIYEAMQFQGRYYAYYTVEQKRKKMNNLNEKQKEIERCLLQIYTRIGIDVPHNHLEILTDVIIDVEETADEINWHSGDVDIAFRRWIEKQSENQP